MRINKGYILAILGFAVLVSSLVMSTPFSGHSEPKAKRSAPPRAPEPAAASPIPDFPDLLVQPEQREAPAVIVQETGPILFKEGELEAYLTFPVPVGKRMVLQTVSARAHVGSGQKVMVQFTATSGGGTSSGAIPMIPQGYFARLGESYAAVHALRAYADGGTVVTFRIDRSAVGELDSGFISITGYLENR